MSTITTIEKLKLEKIFSMASGYVLRFSDSSFREFIKNAVQLDINSEKYKGKGRSKANRLRCFWDKENDSIVGKLTEKLLLQHQAQEKMKRPDDLFDQELFNECLDIAYRLQGKKQISVHTNDTVQNFLRTQVEEVAISSLDLDTCTVSILEQRISEVKKCLKARANLSVVLLCNSILEAVLLGIAMNNKEAFTISAACPKCRDNGHARPFHEWSLSHLVEVAYDAGFISLEVKRFNHSLSSFRNRIDPFQQISRHFDPDINTAKISWQVLKTAISDLSVRTV